LFAICAPLLAPDSTTGRGPAFYPSVPDRSNLPLVVVVVVVVVVGLVLAVALVSAR
jgi:hypothetical protein